MKRIVTLWLATTIFLSACAAPAASTSAPSEKVDATSTFQAVENTAIPEPHSTCLCYNGHLIGKGEYLMLNILIRWLVFLHVLSAITFFLAHGAAAAMIYKVRGETDFTRIRAMLDLSGSTFMAYSISFVVMGITGLIMPFLIHIWDKVYIWLSIALLLFVVVWMGLVNEKQTKQLRHLVGLPYMQGNKEFPAEPPASPEEVAALLKKINPTQWAIVGYGIPAIILWLMIFKPF